MARGEPGPSLLARRPAVAAAALWFAAWALFDGLHLNQPSPSGWWSVAGSLLIAGAFLAGSTAATNSTERRLLLLVGLWGVLGAFVAVPGSVTAQGAFVYRAVSLAIDLLALAALAPLIMAREQRY